MAKHQLLRAATRVLARPSVTPHIVRAPLPTAQRHVSSSQARKNKNDPFHESSSATLGKPGAEHEGSSARTNNNIVFEYAESTKELPTEPSVQGRGGPHLKRTLAQFSLEGRVAIVTGGARGLGLVMAQALVASGANVAIVDLNGMRCSSGSASQY